MNLLNVAKKAGVSTATVSRVINDKSLVNPETKEKVLRVIKELNYQPNLHARNLKYLQYKRKEPKKNFNIGCILFSDFKYSDPYFSRILDGIDREIINQNYNLLFTYTINQLKASPNLLINKINEQNIDGVLVIGYIDKDIYSDIKQRIRNIVVIDADMHDETDCVVMNKFEAVRKLVIKLHDAGHRRIAFIGDCIDPEERFLGYKAGIEDAGLPYDKNLVEWEPGKWSRENGYKYMKKILERTKSTDDGPPTAVFGACDTIALGIMHALKEQGLRIPEDVSVVGYDDIYESEYSSPPLTTLKVDKEELGAMGVRRLIEKINNPGLPTMKTILTVELVIRKSCIIT